MSSYSPPGQHNPFNPYRGYQLPVFGNPFVQQPPPYHGPSGALNPTMRPIPRPVPPPQDVHPAPHPQPRPTTAPPTPPPGIPYIGARISLISNMNIRYEGTLYTIDPKEATVALQSVRCFGTEGRVPSTEEVAPSPHSYQFIIFRGKDIKDLHVCETPVSRFLPTQPPPPQDPAIVATGHMSPFGPPPLGLGSFNKPEVKQPELEQQKVTEERFRVPSTSTEPTPERETDTSKEKGVSWTPGATTSQVPRAPEPEKPQSRTPPKSQSIPTKPTTSQAPPQIPASQEGSKKKERSIAGLEQSKNQYKPKPQSHHQSNQGYQKQGPPKSGQKGQDNRKPRDQSKGAPGGFYPSNQKKSDKKSKGQQGGRQNVRRDDDPSRSGGGGGGGAGGGGAGGGGSVNYDGPGTGSYLGRRVGNPTIAPAIPQGDFDIQSSNARFDKDRFKEQVLKVTAQKAKSGTEGETTPPTTTTTTTTAPSTTTAPGSESAELTDLFKKLKSSGSEKPSPSSTSNQSHLSPSATPFVPAAEGKKESKSDKADEKASIDGVPVPDNLPTAPKYEKKNFYDDISTDRDVSQRRDMVKKDTETFGDIAANYGYYNRQRPRYFNSGGGYRGRGRGGPWRGGSNHAGGGFGGGVLNGASGPPHYRAVQRI